MITRREFLKLLAEGVATLSILRLASIIPSWARTETLRPPGALNEEYFNHLCIRCGICLEACPTGAIKLAGFENGVVAVNTPIFDPVAGPCEFFRGRCEEVMRCGNLCPTGALQLVNREEVKIGTVELSSDRCLAYVGKECLVCYEMCPVPEAITITDDLKPVFHESECVGCGTCVYHCPTDPKALTLGPKGSKRATWSR